MDLNLKDKVAIVTGASSGLGKAIAIAMAKEGAKVAVNYLKNDEKGLDFSDDANAVVAELKKTYGTEAIAVACDMAFEDQILAMFDAVEAGLGKVDVLINNAAYLPKGPITGYTKEEWDYTFQVNVTGCFVACRELVKRLLADERQGRIVNVVSQAAFRGSTTGHLPYDSSKGAMVSFTRALARELGPKGIAVNAVAPGLIRTEMVAKTWEQNKERYLKSMPICRISEPYEIANVVTFAASDGASYMTGATFDVTGGMMMH
ncbi:MAG: glucose 1-dehydrogenase [Kiritimatiellales bacterium]|nr:glucose 1-dehydrogenase [Kiritimatiellales bacterium]